MSIGYACLAVGVPGTKLRSCVVKNATQEILAGLIQSNLGALDKILDYNIKNGVKLFRISSDIIPFGSHPVNTLKWWEIFAGQLRAIGQNALVHKIRLSMHPGQYTVLNSPDETVAGRAIADLKYHAQFLDALGLGQEHKIILHIGGIYGDKTSAINRFITQYRRLDQNIRQRLVIENDDRHYHIAEVLSIGESEGIPVVFDNLHHEVNPSSTHSEFEWIDACGKTWRHPDGAQKIHYSQQNAGRKPGSHSDTLDVEVFTQFYKKLFNQHLDVMVEVKDKNLSAIKCVNAIAPPRIDRLEKEWSRYKYLVLEHSQKIYDGIRKLLEDKGKYPVGEFYKLVDAALASPVKPGNAVNAAQHVWGYFKCATDKRTGARFEKLLAEVNSGKSTTPVKRLLWRLVEKHQQQYLMDSLYFKEFI